MNILIIEDNPEIIEVLNVAFQIRWPDVHIVTSINGEKGVLLAETERPDVIILDLGLPDISGFEVLKQIRAFSDVPILILTARGEENAIVMGLERGADDYVVKPFRQLELMSRIQALTRRTGRSIKDRPLVCGPLTFDINNRQLQKNGNDISITRTEAAIIECLMAKANSSVTHTELAELVWGNDYPDSVESLRVYIRRLRQKVEDDPENPSIILTRSGVGYMLVK